MDELERHAEAIDRLAALVDGQLAQAPARPFAVVAWERMAGLGIAPDEQAAVCKAALGGFVASDGCFVVRRRWQER